MLPTISKWAHHRTTQNNWRIFNMVALSFLKKHGYEIDDDLLKSHLLWVASYHSGDGWYLEQTYNYYTISLFVVYVTIWNRAFGDEHYPEIAAVLEESAQKLMRTYPRFFGRDGFVNMWARSICYRTWISGGFPVSFMLKGDPPLDPGWARRLCSGSLLQFVGREDFYENDVPSLGFYGHREFVLQNYSCPASPFLMFLPFIGLALPEDSPFWTARENDGPWEALGGRSERTVLDSPGLVLVNHGTTGTSEIVPGKTYYEDRNYSKLAFNTHFPWEDHDPEGGTAMEYSYRSLDPRDTRGEDVNFYLTGTAVSGRSGTAGALHDLAEHALQRGARRRALPPGDHEEAAEQRHRLHHRPGRNHHPRRRDPGGPIAHGLRARADARALRPAARGRLAARGPACRRRRQAGDDGRDPRPATGPGHLRGVGRAALQGARRAERRGGPRAPCSTRTAGARRRTRRWS